MTIYGRSLCALTADALFIASVGFESIAILLGEASEAFEKKSRR